MLDLDCEESVLKSDAEDKREESLAEATENVSEEKLDNNREETSTGIVQTDQSSSNKQDLKSNVTHND